jgi:hypothetical protein
LIGTRRDWNNFARWELQVGLLGCILRDQDAECLNVIYAERDTAEAVYFYSKTTTHYELSNFAAEVEALVVKQKVVENDLGPENVQKNN